MQWNTDRIYICVYAAGYPQEIYIQYLKVNKRITVCTPPCNGLLTREYIRELLLIYPSIGGQLAWLRQ